MMFEQCLMSKPNDAIDSLVMNVATEINGGTQLHKHFDDQSLHRKASELGQSIKEIHHQSNEQKRKSKNRNQSSIC